MIDFNFASLGDQEFTCTVEKNILFPEIISRICDHANPKMCKRIEGAAVNVIERACVSLELAEQKDVQATYSSDIKFAVIGAGLSGLAAALALAEKGYDVDVYEKRDKIGGRVRGQYGYLLTEDIIEKDFEPIYSNPKINIYYGASYDTHDSLMPLAEEYAGVYLSLGRRSYEYYKARDIETLQTDIDFVFSADSDSPVVAVSEGRRAAVYMERYAKREPLSELSREMSGV